MGLPVPHPAMSTGARAAFSSTVSICTTMVGFTMPVPRSAEPITTLLDWFIPGLALQFALVVMGSGLRGTGIVKPTMVRQRLTVLLNAALAPGVNAGCGT